MPNKQDEIDGDLIIHGNLDVVGSINDSDVAAILAAAQSTNSTSRVLTKEVEDMLDDGKLTPTEKHYFQTLWDVIEDEYATVLSRAAEYAITTGNAYYDAYVAAYDTLDAYLNTDPGPLIDLTTTTAVDGPTLRTYMSNVYATKEALYQNVFGGTSTPDTPTIGGLGGIRRAFLAWTKQNNLTNFDRYEIQVSDDGGTTAYSVVQGQQVGVATQDTDVYAESFVHEDIPLDGTENIPVNVTLHYRVRCVTKEPVASAWSAWYEITVRSTAAGDVAADAVTFDKIFDKAVGAAKLDDNAVIARTIAATALHWPEDAEAYWPFDEGVPYPDNVAGAAYIQDAWATVDGWTSGLDNALSVSDSHLVSTISGGNPRVEKAGFSFDGGTNNLVFVRFKQTAGTLIDGPCWLYYSTSGHGYSGSYYKAVSVTAELNKYYTLVFDMSSLTAGGADWTTNTITGLRIDLPQDATGDEVIEIDAIYIGTGAYDTKVTDVKNGLEGTLSGGVAFVDGPAGGALAFDGTSGVVSLGTDTAQFTSDFSVAIWIKNDNPAQGGTGVVGNSEYQAGGWSFVYRNGGYLRGIVNNATTQFVVDSGIGALAYDTWVLGVLVLSGTTLSLYVDGVLVDTETGVSITDSGSDLLMGQGQQGGWTGFFNGATAEFRTYSRALTEAEIKSLNMFVRPGRGMVVADQIVANDALINKLVVAGSLIVAGDDVSDLTNDANYANETYADTVAGTAKSEAKEDVATAMEHADYAAMVAAYTALGKTIISGGYINTGLVNTDALVAAAVTAVKMAAESVTAKSLIVGGDTALLTNTEEWDDADGELFALDFSCLSNDGRVPVEKLVHYEPAILRDSNETEYDNPRAKSWSGLTGSPRTDTIGVWKATENLVPYPEDSTEWDNQASTDETLEETFEGVPWLRVECTGTAEAYLYDYFELGADPVSVRCVVRKGPNQTGDAEVRIQDDSIAAGGVGFVFVSVNFSTETVSVGSSGTGISGTLVDEYWIEANEIVSVSFIAAGLSTGQSDTRLILYPDTTEAAGRYADFCMIQVEDSDYPTPYTPSSRPAGVVEYRKQLPDEGAIECWVRGRFLYDGGTHVVWSFYKDLTHLFMLYYVGSNSRFIVAYQWGGTQRFLGQPLNSYASNAAFWQNIHTKVVWDFSAGTGKLIIDGTTEDSAWDGTPDTYDNTGRAFFIGSRYKGNIIWDGEITDLAIHDTEDETTTHYSADKPWKGAYDMPNRDQSVVITRKGMKLTRAELSIIDKKNRSIDVGSQGILARDRQGKIVHNIPNNAILSNYVYGGHLISNYDPGTSYQIYYSTSPPVETWTDIPCNVTDIDNATSVLLLVYGNVTGNGALSQYYSVRFRAKGWDVTGFDQMPNVYNRVDADNSDLVAGSHMIICPIGEDDSIQFYYNSVGGSSTKQLRVVQLGVFS